MQRIIARLTDVLRVLLGIRASATIEVGQEALDEMVDAVEEAIEAIGGIVEWEDERIAFVQEYLMRHYGYAADSEEVAAVIEALDAYESGGDVEFTADFD